MLKIHFLNVGHGDCTIIEFPSGRRMMIDINNASSMDQEAEKELIDYFNLDPGVFYLQKALGGNPLLEKAYDIALTNPVDYYMSNWGKTSIFRFVCTHPDMDHISGLHRLHKIEKIPIDNFWDSEHSFKRSEEDFANQTKYDKADWDTYQEIRSSDTNPKKLWLERHAKGEFYTNDGIYLLASTKQLKQIAHEKDDPNHLSYVLMINYGKNKIILGGDATKEVWEDIVQEFDADTLKATVLKASHHGRESGYHEDAVKAINPTLTIVSVGKKPETDASNKYRKHSDNVWSTRWKGNIVLDCYQDGTINYVVQYDR